MTRGAKPMADAELLPSAIDAAQVQRLIEAGSDLALVLDGEGLVLEVFARDPELAKAARQEWHGRPWAETVNFDSRDKVAALLADALADAAPTPRQLNHPARNGPDLPVQYAALRVAGSGRNRGALRIVALGRDLRDTVSLQRRLVDGQQAMERDYWRFREAETRYRNLFQSSAEAVLIVDGASLRVTEANPAALALLAASGARAGKPVGAAVASLFVAEAAEPLAAALGAARSAGKLERLSLQLAGSEQAISVSVSSFRQEQASFLLLRLAPAHDGGSRPTRHEPRPTGSGDVHARDALASAYVRGAGDAVAFTDTAGRVASVNGAFVRMAQLASEDQARSEPLDRWLGRTGVELSVLLTNLRERGSAGLFVTELRGAQGLVTEVEVSASSLQTLGPAGLAAYAFTLRDVGRRLAPSEQSLPTKVPASVQQLTELVGRVPLKQIVAETSDLIERLSIETALAMTHDNRAMAAQLLGLSRQSLYVKLRRFGMGGLDGGDAA